MYDSIIIGSGPAGITASLYMVRAGLKVLIISKNESTLDNFALINTDNKKDYLAFLEDSTKLELIDNIIYYSKHKFSSNIVEKCFDYCSEDIKTKLMEILNDKNMVLELTDKNFYNRLLDLKSKIIAENDTFCEKITVLYV